MADINDMKEILDKPHEIQDIENASVLDVNK